MSDSTKTPSDDVKSDNPNQEDTWDDGDSVQTEPAPESPKYADDDPLAELARLVSEDNPFTRLDQFERRDAPAADTMPFSGVPEEALPEEQNERIESVLDDPAPDVDESVSDNVEPDFDPDPEPDFAPDPEPEPEPKIVPDPVNLETEETPGEEDPYLDSANLQSLDEARDMIERQLAAELGVMVPSASSETPAAEVDDPADPVAPEFGPVPDVEAFDRARQGDDLPPLDTADPAPSPRFSPVLDDPGDPDFAPVSRVDPPLPPEPEPEPEPIDDVFESVVEPAGSVREPEPQAADDGAGPTFEMPLDLSNVAPAEPAPSGPPGEPDASLLSDPVPASVAAASAVSASLRPDSAAPPATEPPVDDDPFAALEGALKREVDAALRADGDDSGPPPLGADNGDVGEPEDDAEDQPKSRGMMIAATVVGLALLGGLGAFAYRGLVGGDTGAGTPPVITAEGEALKERPADPGGAVVENQDALVFRRADGETDTDQDAQIVPREETVQVLEAPTKSEDRVGETASLGDGSRENPRVIAPEPLSPDGDELAPRRVRTMIVRPDGTIVRATEEGADATAQEGVPAATESAATPEPAATPAAQPDQTTAALPADAQPQPAEPAAETPARVTPLSELGPEDPSIPIPPRRPGDVAASSQPAAAPAAQPAQPAAATPAPQPAAQTATPAVAPVPAADGSYLVQLASRRSQEQALTDFATLQSRYPSLLGNYQPFIERADLGSRGIYYRLRVGPLGTQASAGQLCDQLKAAGLPDCLVRRN